MKKTTAAPHYRSNCFVGALNEPVTYQILLFQGDTGALIGNPIPSQPDNARGLPHRAASSTSSPPRCSLIRLLEHSRQLRQRANSAMIGFCTLETTDNGSADFRVAKSDDARDVRQARLACYGQDDCGSSSLNNSATISDVSKKNIHYMIIDQPDFVKCDLVADAPTMSALEITLRGPGDPITHPFLRFPRHTTYRPIPAVVEARPVSTSIPAKKAAISSGATTRWYIDVQRNAGSGAAGPFNYGITCHSGNGLTVPWFGTTATATP